MRWKLIVSEPGTESAPYIQLITFINDRSYGGNYEHMLSDIRKRYQADEIRINFKYKTLYVDKK